MSTPEPSPQSLSERSSSFNRAEFQKLMRIKASNTDGTGDFESIENLTSITSSAHHIRHSSLDSSHPSALHPINLNSKFDHLFSSLWPVKAFTKVSVDQAGKGRSFLPALDNQKEGGGETQEELILDPHEALLQDAQEESFSTSMSAESPREDLDFILWGNAAFCLSEATVSSKALGLRRQTEKSFGENPKRHHNFLIGKKSHQLQSSDESPCSPARNGGRVISNSVNQNDHVVLTNTDGLGSNTLKESVVGQNEESLKCQSSVGSTLSVCNLPTESHSQIQKLVESPVQKPLVSSEAQSCCLDFEAKDMEASASSNIKKPSDTMQEECSSKGGNDDEEGSASTCNQETTQIGDAMASQLYKESPQDFSLASEEVKIRAELELEIEKDLEQEIRTKIYLLSRRLEELQVLKATRHPQEEQSETQIVVGPSMPSIEREDSIMVKGAKEAPRPKSPPNKSPKMRAVLLEQSRGGSHADRLLVRPSSASSKRQLTTVEKDELLNHANATPFASWKKYAMASGWPLHTKENVSQLREADGGLQNVKVTKTPIERLAPGKPNLLAESTTILKQEYQGWTVSARAKKFDWTQTLRSDAACTPQVSLMKKGVELASPFLPPSKEPLHGSVSRTLFSEEGLSAPPKKTISKTERGDGLMTPSVGCLKRSAFSSSKTSGELVPSTPRFRNTSSGLLTHDIASRSIPSRRATSQKLPLGIHTPSSLHRTPDLRQARIATPSIPRVPPQQPSSCKLGKTEKASMTDALTSPTLSLKNTSPTHAEKAKRSASAPPSMPSRSVNSKESKSAVPKLLPNKHAGSLQQTGASRVATSVKSATPSSQISKGRIGMPPDVASKRSLSKPMGARGKWY
ncbi:hypothetical protein GOP47_0001769 [Adiantum capillus-veneris]|uniref:Uncharacterized protein n=1 Tax=Adiantum capillus-veneris TaxID=13818 RepID=A0A9D4VA76_ADICA|nr:hypothetical protein GOP47_0001769 [Adiantum capillus-veneris]